MLKINYPDDRDAFHKEYINALDITDKMRNNFYRFMTKSTLKRFNINLLDYVLLVSFDELLKISLSFPLSKSEIRLLKLFFNYDYFSKKKYQPKIKYFFEKKMKIRSCYFCNIDFVNSFNDRSDYHDFSDFMKRAKKIDLIKLKGIGTAKADRIILERNDFDNSKYIQNLISKNSYIDLDNKHSHFTLDHVLDKASHPLLALSLYNFVPSCYSCNSKFKVSRQFIEDDSMGYLSPSSDNFSFDNDVKFKLYFYNGKDTSMIQANNDFILDFEYSRNQESYEKYIDIFKLKGRYVFHKDEVLKLVKKKKEYSQSQIDSMESILNISSEQIKREIFGKELFDGKNEEHSMLKFKKDIARDIGII